MARLLGQAYGYQVTLLENATRSDVLRALAKFRRRARRIEIHVVGTLTAEEGKRLAAALTRYDRPDTKEQAPD